MKLHKKDQKLVFHETLRSMDTEIQTEGCRHTNPEICSNNELPGVCSFVREDNLCTRPPRSWAKQFVRLGELGQSPTNNDEF